MKLTQFTVTAGVALALTACGGGGGGSPNVESGTNPQAVHHGSATRITAPSGVIRLDAKTTNVAVSGIKYTQKPDPANIMNRIDTLDEMTIAVGGQNIKLTGLKNYRLTRIAGLKDGWELAVLGANFDIINKYNHVKIFDFHHKDKSGLATESYILYAGDATRNMPNSGTFTYSGEAYPFVVNGQKIFNEKISTFSLNVDMGARTVNGKLNSIQFSDTVTSDIALKGDINSNKFTGTATINSAAQTLGFKNGTVEGGFFGNSAAEVAGIATGANTEAAKQWTSVFIGKK